MSNFGKIKNIWNMDVVSKEEMKSILQEWDAALTKINTLITIKPSNTMPGNGNLQIPLNPKIDNTRPIYIGFEKWDNSSQSLMVSYSIVAIVVNDNIPRVYNNINDIKIYCLNSKLYIGGWNFQSNIVFKNFTIQYTPKTLTTTINETQEEGE